ncbi:hypothetical protein HMPREF0454_03895 [Hafnia alvei ATCC 51873]|uniref:Uncharacterized protein n=1 Tax=Hafnia alvei ATCC 51873 TaxID=1002364 RepID=G9YBB6_HAFAL|nr:hypothetical protein HMPREF0454_03895 [Hafnia alvei ATCC 51873]
MQKNNRCHFKHRPFAGRVFCPKGGNLTRCVSLLEAFLFCFLCYFFVLFSCGKKHA